MNEKSSKPHLFVGRILRRFFYAEGGPAKQFQIEVFKQASTLTSMIPEEKPHLAKDVAN